MKIFSIAAALLITAQAVPAAVIAEWDLSKSLKSADGRFELKIRNEKFVQQTAEEITLHFKTRNIR